MAFLFWAIAIGLSCGAEMYSVALVGSIMIIVILFVFKFYIYEKNIYLAVVRGEGVDISEIEKELKKVSMGKYKLRMQNRSQAGVEVTYEVKIRSVDTTNLAERICTIEGVSAVNIITYTGEIVG